MRIASEPARRRRGRQWQRAWGVASRRSTGRPFPEPGKTDLNHPAHQKLTIVVKRCGTFGHIAADTSGDPLVGPLQALHLGLAGVAEPS